MKVNKEKLYSLAVEMSDEERALANDLKENRALYKASMRIAMKIKRALRLAGKTQKQLANEMNVDPATMSRYLSGKANMELKTLLRFEEILHINIIDRTISPESGGRDEAKRVQSSFGQNILISITGSFIHSIMKEEPEQSSMWNNSIFSESHSPYYNSSAPLIVEEPASTYYSKSNE